MMGPTFSCHIHTKNTEIVQTICAGLHYVLNIYCGPSMMSTPLKDLKDFFEISNGKSPWKTPEGLNGFQVVFLRHLTWNFKSKLQILNETELTLRPC